ncbi:hypothetical protein E4U19_002217 [Claviceps sp. Clav32 group G5]|nr:hypothetical protein E4U19_002217 [Claviceps sp. Clav32 group G5]
MAPGPHQGICPYDAMLHTITIQAGAGLTEAGKRHLKGYEEIQVTQYRVPGTWYFVRHDLANTRPAYAKERKNLSETPPSRRDSKDISPSIMKHRSWKSVTLARKYDR